MSLVGFFHLKGIEDRIKFAMQVALKHPWENLAHGHDFSVL